MNKRDSFIFYRSFFEAIEDLPSENKVEIYTAIWNYSLNFKEPKLTWIAKTVWTLIKPQLEANRKRFENGSKPKAKKSKPEAKPKQDISKPEANKNKNVNNNNNNNLNNNVNDITTATKVATLQSYMLEYIDKETYINKWIPENIVTQEMNKFYNHWVQKNPWSKKEHWQKQKTFDVARRFTTWLWNLKQSNLQPKRWAWLTRI